ncbi:N-acetylmuramoyl-L-alanine amidase [uncultured Odoribacter sp.]|uniref:N-acetylmuramoyl-L-alanine amidase family protein n=1 Tax=uncultured Odoribacter sp. TaxID=876416 RepID=UPI002611C3FC|nr:N-acetylmuramoyl-L-alanine amidase [uncultured Odoribacter sp.]
MIIRCGVGGFLATMILLFFPFFAESQDKLGKIKCICIDAGHGGKDPGCIGLKSYEKNIALSVALKVGKLIKTEYPDIKIVYTREKDEFIELDQRGKIANNHKADLFISIHVNAAKDKTVKGIETYVMGLHKLQANLQVAMKENAAIKYEDNYTVRYAGFDPSRPESYIIFSMMQNLYLGKSLEIAGLVQEELIKSTQKHDRSIRQAGFLVLKDVAMPAILIELGFMSNPEEERFLNSLSGQNKMAGAIARAFQKYKTHVEKNSVVLTPHQTEREKDTLQQNQVSASSLELFYAIQVASAVAPVKNTQNLCADYEIEELLTEKRYRYFVCKSSDLEEVKQKLQKVRKKVKDCFIIAVHKGKLINIAEARRLEKNLK